MAFKMRGFSPFTKNGDDTDKLLKSEHKDTEITGGNLREEINDIEDRISFINEDANAQGKKKTDQQKKDIEKLKSAAKKYRQQIKELKKKNKGKK